MNIDYSKLREPMALAQFLWPQWTFYDKQREIIASVDDNDETVVPAGNMLGKDFTAGYICLRYFLIHKSVRVITTSVKDDHLRVLWGEIGRFVQTSRLPLSFKEGGPLILNHRDIRKVSIETRKVDEISYMRGMVSERGEGLAGHHADKTLLVIDEATGVDDLTYTQGCTWAKKVFMFGNCNDCNPDHFFRKAVEDGDVPYDESIGEMLRKRREQVDADDPTIVPRS